MSDLWQCRICKSLVERNQIDGVCRTCGRNTCVNCRRICDRDMAICCMFHIEPKVVMRDGKTTVYHLCEICWKVW